MDNGTFQIYLKCKRIQKVAFNILFESDTQKWKTCDLVDGIHKAVDRLNEDRLNENARCSVLLHLKKVISYRESIAPRLIPCSGHVYFVTVLKKIISIIELSMSRHENCFRKEPTTFTVPKEIVPVIEMSTSELETGFTFESTITELREQFIEEIEDGVFLDIIRDQLQCMKVFWSKATKNDISVATAAAGKSP